MIDWKTFQVILQVFQIRFDGGDKFVESVINCLFTEYNDKNEN